jgi:hypothetical protein
MTARNSEWHKHFHGVGSIYASGVQPKLEKATESHWQQHFFGPKE